MALNRLLTSDTQVVLVVCNQWGDTGKGKVIHHLAPWADVYAKGTGGNNAGHTVIVDDKEVISHFLPIGILYDREKKINILGNGMVIEPELLLKEIEEFGRIGCTFDNLMVSEEAHVIMPYHQALDRARDQSLDNGGIGSTGKGIGPCYTDKTSRHGIRITDLFKREILRKKLVLAKGHYGKLGVNVDVDGTIDRLRSLEDDLKPFVRDTKSEIYRLFKEGKKILGEGAQGLLLSSEYGTYPYVTSSDPSIYGTAAGIGIPAAKIDLTLGLLKFPFMTRVGGGPFPTEFGGNEGEKYCRLNRKVKAELEHYKIPYTEVSGHLHYDHYHPTIMAMINSAEPVETGAGIRLIAGEFGATTQRPRRIGRTDLEAARYACQINGPQVILTKVDCLSGADSFELGLGYKDGAKFTTDCAALNAVVPEIRKYKGYGSIDKVTTSNELPSSLREAIHDLENYACCRVVGISNGPKQNQMIEVEP